MGLAIAIAVLVVAAGAFIWWNVRGRMAEWSGMARVRAVAGAARCVAAADLLARLGAAGRSAPIARVWPELEPLLLHALPDCPPDLKPRLAQACEDCSAACKVRATAHALMDVRNSLEP
jgi:hypothetical protein